MVLGAYSERIQHHPYVATANGRPLPEIDSRESHEAMAVIYTPEEKATVAAGRDHTARANLESSRVAIDRFEHPEIDLRTGDRLIALDRPGQPRMIVGKVTNGYRSMIIAEVSVRGEALS